MSSKIFLILSLIFAGLAGITLVVLQIKPDMELANNNEELVKSIPLRDLENQDKSFDEVQSNSQRENTVANIARKVEKKNTSSVTEPKVKIILPPPAQKTPINVVLPPPPLPPPIKPPSAPQNSQKVCTFISSQTPMRTQILINELAWMGGSGDPNAEWMELKNISATTMNLSGWQVIDEKEQIHITLPSHNLPFGDFYLLERTNNAVSALGAHITYSGSLANADEGLRLFNPDCVLHDEVLANPNWEAGDNNTKQTMERDSSGFLWHTSRDPGGTPKAENSLPLPPPAPPSILPPSGPPAPPPSQPPSGLPPQPPPSTPPSGAPPPPQPPPAVNPPPPSTGSGPPAPPTAPQSSNVNHLLISEIQTSGGPGATTNDFIELYNPTEVDVNLKGYRLVKRTASSSADTLIKSWTSDTIIKAHGFYMWVNSAFTSISITPDVTTSQSIADNNGIAIRFGADDTGTIIDSVAWGEGINNGFGEGELLLNIDPNTSVERNAWQGSCIQATGPLGNGCDTDNNRTDFSTVNSTDPQNSGSAVEP